MTPCRRTVCLLHALFCLLLPGAAAWAHIEEQYESIHFHSGAPDFGTPPRRAFIAYRGEYDDRPLTRPDTQMPPPRSGVELDDDRMVKAWEARERLRKNMLQSALAYESAGRWRRALRTYRWVANRYRWEGNIRDRVEVLQRMEAMRGPLSHRFVRALRLYLQGMALYDAGKLPPAEAMFQRIADDQAAGFLREHTLYQLASLEYEQDDFAGAIRLYRRLLRRYPRTHKQEAALLMIARCALLPAAGNRQDREIGGAALARLQREYPHTRFHRAVLGLRGRLCYCTGRYPEALRCYFALRDLESVEKVRDAMPAARQGDVRVRLLAEYLRRLANATSYGAYERAVLDIDRTRKWLGPSEAHHFFRLLLREIEFIPPYLYYRLYHCDNRPEDFAHLARLVAMLVDRYRAAQLPPLVRVRLAEVYYQRRQYTRSLRWAERAAAPVATDRILYVRGASLHKLGRYDAALADFRRLLRDFPNSPLRRGAREETAILCEAVGDLEGALEQYFALGYTADIAFFVDAKMMLAQIEHYLDRHPDPRVYRLPEESEAEYQYDLQEGDRAITTSYRLHDLLAYSLGIRYLRAEKWGRAAHWLRQVPYKTYVAFSKGRKHWGSRPSPEPLTALRDLRRLHTAVAAARSDNVRAAALFRYATYYYTHGVLLLYNPALWRGDRAMDFGFWWNADHATPQDDADARSHMYSTEVYARVLAICREIARRYPRSPVAPRALYRAACSARYLAALNPWWRAENDRHSHWVEAVVLMKRLALHYPNDPLAHAARKYAAVFAGEASGSER